MPLGSLAVTLSSSRSKPMPWIEAHLLKLLDAFLAQFCINLQSPILPSFLSNHPPCISPRQTYLSRKSRKPIKVTNLQFSPSKLQFHSFNTKIAHTIIISKFINALVRKWRHSCVYLPLLKKKTYPQVYAKPPLIEKKLSSHQSKDHQHEKKEEQIPFFLKKLEIAKLFLCVEISKALFTSWFHSLNYFYKLIM